MGITIDEIQRIGFFFGKKKIQRSGNLVVVGLVNGRTDQEMKSLFTAVISFKVRTLVCITCLCKL
jgi:hypothetical protein